MERRVVFDQWQKAVLEDFENLGKFPRESFDHLTKDCGPGWGYTGFPVQQTAPTVVTIGNGRLFDDQGLVYFNDNVGGVQIDMLTQRPVATKKIATIVAWGQEIDSETEPRTFITDTNTRDTEAKAKSTENRRWCNVQAYYGVESPDPQRPTIPSNVIAVAYVTLNTTGVESIVMDDNNRVRSLKDHNSDLIALNIWKAIIAGRIDTLASELAALASRINNLTPLDTFLRAVVDITRLKEKADLPDSYTAWASDYFLDDVESDTEHVDYLARIEEGLRFSHAAERVAYLALQNPIDDSVKVSSNFVLPKYTEIRRLGNVAIQQYATQYNAAYYYYRIPVLSVDWWGHVYYTQTVYGAVLVTAVVVPVPPAEISISQYANQSLPYRHYGRARLRVRWGAPYFYSSRINFWWDRRHDPVWWTFHRYAGDGAFIALAGPPFYTAVAAYAPFVWKYQWLRTRWYWRDWIVDYHYWDRYYSTASVNGSVVAQTFLNAQDGYLTAMHLFFTRRGAAGDVTVLICETTETGQPNVNAVIGIGSVERGHIQIWPKATRVDFPPVFLAAGKRYAFVPVTAGAHYCAMTDRNQYTNGTLFYSTDQIWFQGVGDMTKDLAFELVFAEFSGNRTIVQLEPAELSGGIAAIDINTDAIEPEGTSLTYEVQLNGVWTPLNDPGPDGTEPALVGLPPLSQLRAVLQGTTSVMPGFMVGSTSQLYTWRPRSDLTHISEERIMPTAVDSATVTLRIENWRDSPHHSLTCALLKGASFDTTHDAASVADEVAPDDPDAIIRKVSFTSLGSISAYKIKITGTTDNVLTPFHVAERIDIALA